jgi:hypothetical protein
VPRPQHPVPDPRPQRAPEGRRRPGPARRASPPAAPRRTPRPAAPRRTPRPAPARRIPRPAASPSPRRLPPPPGQRPRNGRQPPRRRQRPSRRRKHQVRPLNQARTPPRRCQRRASPGQPRLPQRRTRVPPELRQRRLRLSHPHPARLLEPAKTPFRRCQRRASSSQPPLPRRRTRLRPAAPRGYRPPTRHHRRARHPVRQGIPQPGRPCLPCLPRQAWAAHGRWRPARARLHPVQAIRRRTRHRPVTRRACLPMSRGGSRPPPPDHARFRLGPRLTRWQRLNRCRRCQPLTGPRHRAPVQQPTRPRQPRTHRRTPAGSSPRCRVRCPTSSLPPEACGCCRPRAMARAHRPVRHPPPGSARQPPARRPRHRYLAGPGPGPRPPPLRPPILRRLPRPQPRAPHAAQLWRRRRPFRRPS